jgi:hypothetical protein
MNIVKNATIGIVRYAERQTLLQLITVFIVHRQEWSTKKVSQLNAAIVICLPSRGCTGGQFEPAIITVSAAKRKNKCGLVLELEDW